jgi:hypothetical protein
LYHRLSEGANCEAHNADTQNNQPNVKNPTGLGKSVDRIRTNGRYGHQGAVKGIEPIPALDDVEAHGSQADQDEHQKENYVNASKKFQGYSIAATGPDRRMQTPYRSF